MTARFETGYYSEADLATEGFRALGRNVRIARNCTIVGVANIAIGDNVRIDPYCSLIAAGAGEIVLGSYIHIGGYCFLSGGDGIEMGDFSGLSQGVCVYSRTDDYSGEWLTNPTVPAKYTSVIRGRVVLGRHVIVGSGTVILPGAAIGEGASVGALSLVTKSLEGWGVYFGAPAKRLRARSQRILELEAALRAERAGDV
jgi:acetyltransferase-like isoleucine patch superfamily enzyme